MATRPNSEDERPTNLSSPSSNKSRDTVQHTPTKRSRGRSPVRTPKREFSSPRLASSPGRVLSPVRALSPARGGTLRSPGIPGTRKQVAAPIRSSPFASPASKRQRSSLYYKAVGSPAIDRKRKSPLTTLAVEEMASKPSSAARLFVGDDEGINDTSKSPKRKETPTKFTVIKRHKPDRAISASQLTEHQIEVAEENTKTESEVKTFVDAA